MPGLEHHPHRSRSHHHGSSRWNVRLPERFHNLADVVRRVAEVEHEDLVLSRVQRSGKPATQRSELDAAQVADEHAELGVVTVVAEHLEHRRPTLVVGNVVGH